MLSAEGCDEALTISGGTALVGERGKFFREYSYQVLGEHRRLSNQRGFGLVGAGGIGGDAAVGEEGFLDNAVIVKVKSGGEGDGGDVHLTAFGDFRKGAHPGEMAGDIDGDEKLFFLEDGGAIAGEEFVERNGSLAQGETLR